MIQEYTHKINERVTLIKENSNHVLRFRIRRIADGWYFYPPSNNFVNVFAPINQGELWGDLDNYWYPLNPFFEYENVKRYDLITLPSLVQDLVFEYEYYDYVDPEAIVKEVDETTIGTFLERHTFGGAASTSEPSTCTVFGTLRDVSGKPLAGQKVEAYLNKAGFFTHKAGLVGYAATALTNDTGYFALPLIVGLDVTINVPIVGFTTRGFVPSLPSVELTTQALLNSQPGN